MYKLQGKYKNAEVTHAGHGLPIQISDFSLYTVAF